MSELDDILKDGNKGRLPEDILMAYLEGRLTPGQQHEVEAWLAAEGMESDAVEGLKELPAAETTQIVNRLNHNLHHQLANKKRRHQAIKNNQWAWIAVIIVLMLCVLGYVVVKMRGTEKRSTTLDTAHAAIIEDRKVEMITLDPNYRFKNYAAGSLYSGVKHVVKLETPLAKKFKTAIRTTYEEEGLNFAGHYCFVYWGCGSPCQMSAVVDLITGKVYEGPIAGYGYGFRKDSRMLIVNIQDTTWYEEKGGVRIFHDSTRSYEKNCVICPAIWVWNESAKNFELQFGEDLTTGKKLKTSR